MHVHGLGRGLQLCHCKGVLFWHPRSLVAEGGFQLLPAKHCRCDVVPQLSCASVEALMQASRERQQAMESRHPWDAQRGAGPALALLPIATPPMELQALLAHHVRLANLLLVSGSLRKAVPWVRRRSV